jgi:hypothetical protein
VTTARSVVTLTLRLTVHQVSYVPQFVKPVLESWRLQGGRHGQRQAPGMTLVARRSVTPGNARAGPARFSIRFLGQ